MSLRLYGTISGWGRSAGAVIPALGSGRYSPGPNIVLPSWLQGSDPHCTLNVCWGQPGALATVSFKPDNPFFHNRRIVCKANVPSVKMQLGRQIQVIGDGVFRPAVNRLQGNSFHQLPVSPQLYRSSNNIPSGLHMHIQQVFVILASGEQVSPGILNDFLNLNRSNAQF